MAFLQSIPDAWVAGLTGGLLIGVAAFSLLWLIGRIAGISGIVGGLLAGAPASDRAWRLAFLAGLLLAGALAAPEPVLNAGSSPLMLVVPGLLVGFGTRLGNGCTSGHGVCGLARLSWRSLVATLVFMSAGIATVTVLRHGGF